MTKEEILKTYDVNSDGIIISPGRFEGEMRYIPKFYDWVMVGGSDQVLYDSYDRPHDLFVLDDEIKKEFPELKSYSHILLWSDDNGFVFSDVFDVETEYKNPTIIAQGECWNCKTIGTEFGSNSGLCLGCLLELKNGKSI